MSTSVFLVFVITASPARVAAALKLAVLPVEFPNSDAGCSELRPARFSSYFLTLAVQGQRVSSRFCRIPFASAEVSRARPRLPKTGRQWPCPDVLRLLLSGSFRQIAHQIFSGQEMRD
jgi:hypothetical protein